MPGPLPKPGAVRRNKPTIPTTSLPVSGRKGRPPAVPKWMKLGSAGTAWWRWAWKTPQAAGWNDGHHVAIARRAALEDDVAALDAIEGLNLFDVLDAESASAAQQVVARVAALVTGRLKLLGEMRELDGKLGLTPKGQADLRWEVVDDAPATPARATAGDDIDAQVHALYAVNDG